MNLFFESLLFAQFEFTIRITIRIKSVSFRLMIMTLQPRPNWSPPITIKAPWKTAIFLERGWSQKTYWNCRLSSRELRQNLLLYGVLFFRSKALSIKKRSSEVMPSLNLLQKNLMARSKDIGEVCERNIYTIQFLLTIAELKQVRTLTQFSM